MIHAGAQGDSFFGIPNPRGVRGIVHISPCCCQFPVLSDCVVACAGRSMRYCLISFKPELSLAAETANPDDDGLLRASFPSYHPTSGRRGFSLSYWTCWISAGFSLSSCRLRAPPPSSDLGAARPGIADWSQHTPQSRFATHGAGHWLSIARASVPCPAPELTMLLTLEHAFQLFSSPRGRDALSCNWMKAAAELQSKSAAAQQRGAWSLAIWRCGPLPSTLAGSATAQSDTPAL